MARNAIVTGAGSGIGRAVARTLLKAGYRVALAGRRREQLEDTAQGLPTALVVPTDVAKSESVAALFRTASQKFGRIDLLFNNAGVNAPPVPFEDLEDEQWLNVVNINMTGMFYCAREAVRVMERETPQGGRIINNRSIPSLAPRP